MFTKRGWGGKVSSTPETSKGVGKHVTKYFHDDVERVLHHFDCGGDGQSPTVIIQAE